MSTVPANFMRTSRSNGTGRPRGGRTRRGVRRPMIPACRARSRPSPGAGRVEVRGRILDEAGPAADRAERVDRAVVLGEMPRGRAIDGHPADGIEQDDVVDDRLDRRDGLPSGSPASVAGPGAATKGARPRRTWTSSARIESAISSAVSAPRSMPAGARRRRAVGQPVSSRSHWRTTLARVGEATRPTYDALRRRPAASASSSQTPWVATTIYGRVASGRPGRGWSPGSPPRPPGTPRQSRRSGRRRSPASRMRRRGSRGRRQSGSCRRPTGAGGVDAVPRRSPGFRRSGRS